MNVTYEDIETLKMRVIVIMVQIFQNKKHYHIIQLSSKDSLIFVASPSPITAGLLAWLIVVSPFIPNAAALKCVKQWDDPGLGGTCWYCSSTSGMHRMFLGAICQ
jgi:hypothetical protein